MTRPLSAAVRGPVVTVLLAGAALLLPLLAGCSKDEGKALPAPKPAGTTTTTEPIDVTRVSLEPIAVTGRETSTTRPLGGGKAKIFGAVLDPDANPVAGAFVRATFYGDPGRPEVIEALSGEDGTYRFEQVLGGRWRVRAWKTPELATFEDSTFFLGYSEERQLNLKVKAAVGDAVTSSIAPASPFIGSPVELAVAVMRQSVDEEGVVHRSPIAGGTITLVITGRWSLAGDPTKATDYEGRAAWQLTCDEVGPQSIAVIVGGREWPLVIPPCHDPAETSTTTATTRAPGASTTSSTKPKASNSDRPPSYATTSTKPKASGQG